MSPSPPGDRYLKLGSKSDLRAEISGSIVWYDALAPRPEVLLLLPFYLRMRSSCGTEVLTTFVGKNIRFESSKLYIKAPKNIRLPFHSFIVKRFSPATIVS